MKKTTWSDWYNSVKDGFTAMKSWNPTHLLVVGFSMGGALSVLPASEVRCNDGLVLLAPAIRVEGVLPMLVPLVKHFVSDRKVDIVRAQETYEIKRTKYPREPISAYHELFKLQRKTRQKLRKATTPTIIIQGTNDRTISPRNGQIVYNGIKSRYKKLHRIADAGHVIPCHWTRARAYALIQEFAEEIAAKN